ncbi:ATP-binding protein, partial [Streptomyces solincola]
MKIVVVGGFGVGKTTLVRSVSEIRPLNTEETMTRAGEAVDDTSGV